VVLLSARGALNHRKNDMAGERHCASDELWDNAISTVGA
jgi:hypothetical protein